VRPENPPFSHSHSGNGDIHAVKGCYYLFDWVKSGNNLVERIREAEETPNECPRIIEDKKSVEEYYSEIWKEKVLNS